MRRWWGSLLKSFGKGNSGCERVCGFGFKRDFGRERVGFWVLGVGFW